MWCGLPPAGPVPTPVAATPWSSARPGCQRSWALPLAAGTAGRCVEIQSRIGVASARSGSTRGLDQGGQPSPDLAIRRKAAGVNIQSDVPASGPASAPELTFWGVRGSRPVPGPGMLLYCGDTACIEVRLPQGRYAVDAGTGIVNLGRRTHWPDDEPSHLLMTHLHHDHVTGLPFFGPVHQQGCEIHVWCGNPGGASAEAALLALLAPPLFPLTPEQMPARFIVHGFHAGKMLSIGPDRIRAQASIPPRARPGSVSIRAPARPPS